MPNSRLLYILAVNDEDAQEYSQEIVKRAGRKKYWRLTNGITGLEHT